MELLKGIVALVAGVVIFFNPAEALVAIATYLGVLAIISGLVVIIVSLYRKSAFWKVFFGQGIFFALIGLLIVTYPEISASLLIFFIGLFITLMGIIQLSAWFRMRQMAVIRPLALLNAVISILVGATLLFNPFEGAIFATVITGIYAIIFSVIKFYTAFRIISSK